MDPKTVAKIIAPAASILQGAGVLVGAILVTTHPAIGVPVAAFLMLASGKLTKIAHALYPDVDKEE